MTIGSNSLQLVLNAAFCYELIFFSFSFPFYSIYTYISQYCLELFTFLLSYPKVRRNGRPEYDRFTIITHAMHDPYWTVDHSDLLSNPLLLTDYCTYAFIVSRIVLSFIGYAASGLRALVLSIYTVHM